MRKIVLSVFTTLLLCFQLAAQTQRVTGTVTDATTGETLMGATVFVTGTNNATITGANGDYTIDVPANATLTIEYLGYASQVVSVAPGQTVIDVQLAEDNEEIEQIVVIGYGTGREVGTITGSVSVVDAQIINEQSVMNVTDALAGQIPGASIMTSSGEPSASSSIRIHGYGSLSAGTEPLYVIDGIPSSGNQFLAINSNDIESIVTLKDASATSIYGSRAANGVIYVTTKKGRKNQNASFSFRGSYGLSEPVNNYMSNMSANDLLLWERYFGEISAADLANYQALLEAYGPTDWFRYIYQTAPAYSGEFSVSGGSENISYYVSGSYNNQDGMAPGSSMERYTMRTNLSAQATSWLRLDLSLAGSADKRETTQTAQTSQGINITSVTNFPIYMPSYMTKYDADGNKYIEFPNRFYDPYYVMSTAPGYGRNHLLNGNVALTITPVKGLTITSRNGLDGAYSTTTFSNLPSHFAYKDAGNRVRAFSQYYTLTTSNTAEYKFSLPNRDHDLSVLVGQEGIDYYSDAFQVSTQNQVDDRLMLLSNGTTVLINNVTESNASYNMLSFFGRVNYGYKNKYVFDVTLRNDASSKFGPDNRNALFYAIGGMWNAKEEKFLYNSKVVSDLKVRLTYGTQGNSDIGLYDHLALVGADLKYANGIGKYLGSVGNNMLGWETQALLNASVEIGFWNWLAISAGYYHRATSNMLFSVPYAPSTGITARMENVLKMVNQGVDLDISATFFHNKDWNVGASLTFSYNDNKITKLYGETTEIPLPDYMKIYKEGHSANNYYMPIFMGVDPLDGRPMYDDGNGNPVKDTNLAANIMLDKEIYAPMYGGFNLFASWKGLSLQANFTYQINKWLLNGDRFFREHTIMSSQIQRPEYMKNIWREPGQITDIPRYGENTIYSTQYLEDASYLRLKNLTIAYQLPDNLMKKTGFIKGIKVSAQFRNLWTLTKFTGTDPEYDSNIVYGMYPNARMYTFGLEITF